VYAADVPEATLNTGDNMDCDGGNEKTQESDICAIIGAGSGVFGDVWVDIFGEGTSDIAGEDLCSEGVE